MQALFMLRLKLCSFLLLCGYGGVDGYCSPELILVKEAISLIMERDGV